MNDRIDEHGEQVDEGAHAFRRLDSIVRALPETEIASLIRRLGIRIDPQKRIDVPSQVARSLVGTADVREPGRLPGASQELLFRLAEARGLLEVSSLPAGFELLMARGIVFARRAGNGFELVLPYAYLVQLPARPTEDARGMRALVAQAPVETLTSIASHYLGRPATPPLALALEAAWQVLNDSTRLRQEIERLPLPELRLLEAIDGMGGEVETTELLDLEREPMRLRSAKGVSTTRRGAGFALERRALLIPVHPNRHVVPTEVAAIVGAERRREREARRATIRGEVVGEDHMPRRAQFARDPAALALALVACARESPGEVKPNVGTPRSLILRLSQRLGRSTHSVSLVAALSRAVGLWEPTASSASTPPGSLTVAELAAQLFSTWLNGASWDEARLEPEVLRAPPDQRDPSPTRALREIVLDGLAELGVDGWVPYAPFERYVVDDPRLAGHDRLLRRWADRVGVGEPLALTEIVRRIVIESLPVLGIVDLGSESEVIPALDPNATSGDVPQVVGASTTVRLTPKGRAVLASLRCAGAGGAPGAGGSLGVGGSAGSSVGEEAGPSTAVHGPTLIRSSRDPSAEVSRFVDTQVLRVGTASLVGHVLSLSVLAEVGRVEDTIDLVLSPATLARAISAGALSDEIRDRIEALCPLSESLSQQLVQASVVVGKGALLPCSGFIWVDDPDVRELLRTRRTTQDLFLDPSPPGGLLVAPGVDLDRLIRRCRGLGVELEISGEGLVRTIPPRGSASRSVTPYPGFAVEAPVRPTRAPSVAPPARQITETRAIQGRSRTPYPKTKG
jgi:hypothetical protein